MLDALLQLPGVGLSSVDLCLLYSQPDPTRFLAHNRILQQTLREYARWRKNKRITKGREAWIYTFYTYALEKPLSRVMDVFPRLLKQFTFTQPQDVFFWCAFQSNLEMARVVWPLCAKPVHVALMGSAISHMLASHSSSVEAAAIAQAQAKTLEEWAIGAIQSAPTRHFAQQTISMGCLEDDEHNALEIAMRGEAKQFLMQPHVQDLVDLMWRGGSVLDDNSVVLTPGFSYSYLALQVFFPFLVQGVRKDLGEQHVQEDSRLRALKQAQRLASEERKAINTKVKLHQNVRLGVATSHSPPKADDSSPKRFSPKKWASHRKNGISMHSERSDQRKLVTLATQALVDRVSLLKSLLRSLLSWPFGSVSNVILPPVRREVLSSFYSVPAVRFISHAMVHSSLFTFQASAGALWLPYTARCHCNVFARLHSVLSDC